MEKADKKYFMNYLIKKYELNDKDSEKHQDALEEPEVIEIIDKCFEDKTKITHKDVKALTKNDLLIEIIEEHLTEIGKMKTDEKCDKVYDKISYEYDLINVFFNEISKFPVLDPKEEIELFEILNSYPEDSVGYKKTRKKLIECNIKLVINNAKRETGKGVEFIDLIQEGILGLYDAIDGFDLSKGFKFSTYATWWIQQKLKVAVAEKSRPVRLPMYKIREIYNYKATEKQFESQYERKPTKKELAEILNITQEKVEELIILSKDPMYLDETIGTEEYYTYGDTIPSTNKSLNKQVEENELSKILNEILDTELNAQEEDIIRRRMGLNETGTKETLVEIAKDYNLSKQRIGQIEKEALKKLKMKQSVRRKLEEYYPDSQIEANKNNEKTQEEIKKLVKTPSTNKNNK